MPSLTRRALFAGAAVTAASVLAGCNSSAGGDAGQPQNSTPTGSAGAAGFPVTIASALGSVTIPTRPTRVVTLGWGSDDACLALGVKPIGAAVNLSSSSDGLTPWARTAYGSDRPVTFSSDTDSIPYEKIAGLTPDLILAVYSGLTADQYAKLSAIAPTVGYPDKPWATTWPDQLRIVGTALGRADQATTVTQQVQQAVAAKAAEHPEFRGKTAIFGSLTQPGSYNLYLPDDPRMQLLGQLGFTVSDAASTTFTHGASSPTFATTISFEQLPKLDVDVLVSWYFDAATAAKTAKEPVFAELRPVRDKAYVAISDPQLVFATSAPNALSIPWMLNSYVPLLATAAKNAG